jgi:LPXTG-motif cell wall-anchored protein
VDLDSYDLGPNALAGEERRDEGLPLTVVAGLGSAGIIAAAAGFLLLRRRRDARSADEGASSP